MTGFGLARKFGLRRGALIAFAIALLVPASAAARPTTFVDATLPATDDFRVFVSGFRSQLSIDLASTATTAGFMVRGEVKPRRLTGNFEQFGTVDLRFEPRGKPRRRSAPRGCTGSFTVRRGAFVGTFSLHPGDGLPDVEASSLNGRVVRDNIRCGRPDFPDGPRRPKPTERETYTEVSLEASDSRGAYGTQLYVTHRTDRKQVRYDAYRSRRVGSVSTYIGASARGPRSSFAYDVRASTATVQPPAPFTGTGLLGSDEYGVPTWGGDLSISLFGATTVPLTGGTFQASLGRYRVTQVTLTAPRPASHRRGPYRRW